MAKYYQEFAISYCYNSNNCMQGCTPLYLAAQGGHIDVLKLLLASGANAVGKSVGVSHGCACSLLCVKTRIKQFHTLT